MRLAGGPQVREMLIGHMAVQCVAQAQFPVSGKMLGVGRDVSRGILGDGHHGDVGTHCPGYSQDAARPS
jgi:hypothetical protein